MNIRPILSSLRRHKTAALLIVLEIALSCAIICNAVFLIGERLERLRAPSGAAESEVIRIQLSRVSRIEDPAQRHAALRADLAALRAVPGVKAVANSGQVPFGNSSWNSGVNLAPGQTQASMDAATYLGSEDLLEALGLRLIAGRDLRADEYVRSDDLNEGRASPPTAVISAAMAKHLFPGESALGKLLYVYGDEHPMRVVGIVEHLRRPRWVPTPGQEEYSMIVPVILTGGDYVLRTDPARRDEVMKAALAALDKVAPNRIVLEQDTLEEIRADALRADRSMAWLLVAVIVALLVVTALGIVGLASFWVQQRTKQIGVRRALGATRTQILRYFQAENFLLATFGIALGMLGAYGINQLLMSHYELPRLPAMYLPIGALVLWALGQLSVLGPALRAAAVPPAVATRSV